MLGLVVFAPLLLVILADPCLDCLNAKNRWCADGNSSYCETTSKNCSVEIKDTINCPRTPDPAYGYDETFARGTVLNLIAAVYSPDPVTCLANQLPSVRYYTSVKVQCDQGPKNSTCHCYVAYDVVNKAIIVVFEGTEGNTQLMDEIDSFFQEKVRFFDDGHIYRYFNDAFFYLWNGGLGTAVRQLQYNYPGFALWSLGHSLGGSMATVLASYAAHTGQFDSSKIRLVTFGQPRTGDKKFAEWHDNTLPYSYRIIHHHDPVPHVPPLGGPDEVFHHRFEVWYDNNMAVGQPYTLCAEADGPFCSNQVKVEQYNPINHVWYFDTELNNFADQKCPKS